MGNSRLSSLAFPTHLLKVSTRVRGASRKDTETFVKNYNSIEAFVVHVLRCLIL